MTGYKKIIANRVGMTVTQWVEKKTSERKVSERYAFTVSDSLELQLGDKDFDHPSFKITVEVGWHDYSVHGGIDDYGTVIPCSVWFTRTYCDEDGSNQRTKEFIIYGKELDEFKFDR